MIGLKRKWLRHTLKILQHLFGTEKLKWFLLTAESTFQESFSQQNFYTYARAKTAMSPRHRLHSIYCKIALILRTFIIIFSLEILSPDLKRNSWIRNTKFSEDWPFNFWSSNVTYTAVYLVGDVKYTAVYLVGDVKYTVVYLVGDVKYTAVYLVGDVKYTAVHLVDDVKYMAVYLVGDVKYTAVYLVGDVKMRIVNLSYSGVTAWKVSKYEVFFGRIFLYSDWIRRFTQLIFVFSPNTGKYGPEITPYLGTFHAVRIYWKDKFIAPPTLIFPRKL